MYLALEIGLRVKISFARSIERKYVSRNKYQLKKSIYNIKRCSHSFSVDVTTRLLHVDRQHVIDIRELYRRGNGEIYMSRKISSFMRFRYGCIIPFKDLEARLDVMHIYPAFVISE